MSDLEKRTYVERVSECDSCGWPRIERTRGRVRQHARDTGHQVSYVTITTDVYELLAEERS